MLKAFIKFLSKAVPALWVFAQKVWERIIRRKTPAPAKGDPKKILEIFLS